MRAAVLFLVLTCSLASANTSQKADPDDAGMEGSLRLGVPEPMVFDLVRPLGARRGEIEVNALGLKSRSGSLHLAPEIEYTFSKGRAIELELPMVGRKLEDIKLAFQATLPAKRSRRWTHGLQGIGEVGVGHQRGWETSGLYLFGVRWHRNWSTMSMGGAAYRSERRADPLVNQSVFYERFSKAALGVEWNRRGLTGAQAHNLVMPQVHVKLTGHVNLQVGGGRQKQPGSRDNVLSWRLIRQF